jgi:hypothetical protein
MKFFKWKRLSACHHKQDILNQIDLIRPRTGNILVSYTGSLSASQLRYPSIDKTEELPAALWMNRYPFIVRRRRILPIKQETTTHNLLKRKVKLQKECIIWLINDPIHFCLLIKYTTLFSSCQLKVWIIAMQILFIIAKSVYAFSI